MAKRLVHVAAGLVLVGIAPFTYFMPEIRLALVVFAAANSSAAWWVANRLPPVHASALELRGFALVSLVAGIGAAVLVPSSRVACDCPPPPGVTVGYVCNCPIDRHVALRSAIAIVSVALSVILAATARRRARALSPTIKD